MNCSDRRLVHRVGRNNSWHSDSRELSLCLILAALGITAVHGGEPAKQTPTQHSVIVVVGAGGTDEYETEFQAWAKQWKLAAKSPSFQLTAVGVEKANSTDRDLLQQAIAEESEASESPLWIVLLGHGTSDRDVAKFNLRGPDLSAAELNDWLGKVQRPLIVANCSSCSGPFIAKLKAKRRVVVSATKSGAELNYARFGKFFSSAWTNSEADLDHDNQTSLLEAFLFASHRVARFYREESRLATEHALLDDNGDGKGTPADFFVGIRIAKQAKGNIAPDGRRAHQFILVPDANAPQLTPVQFKKRNELEDKIEALRDQKDKLDEDDYYAQLEPIMIKLAQLLTE